MRSVLIAYYTQTGTTKEICDYIGDELIKYDMEVTIKPLDHVTGVDYYDLIIVGTPIHGMRIDESTKLFLEKHLATLKKKDIALFYNSYLLGNGRKFWQSAIRRSYDQYKVSLTPLAIGGFYGRIDKHFTGLAKFLLGPSDTEPLDRREWSQVDQFVVAIAKKLIAQSPVESA